MKYVIIIPDGAADLPLDELGGKTPFEAARMPNLAWLAQTGHVGLAHTTPEGFEAGSDVCSMSLLGYDPSKYHTGRAPLEAAALGITPGPDDWIFRLNLVTTGDSQGHFGTGPGTKMLDHSAGAITDHEARVLVADLMSAWSQRDPALAKGLTLTPGVSYRNILVDASGRSYTGLHAAPPHGIPGEVWRDHLPRGGPAGSAEALKRLMELSAEVFAEHEVNLARREAGLKPATMAWIWGEGKKPGMPAFSERFGLRGAMITSVDLLAGIAQLMGWERLHVPGLTSYHDTDYAAQGKATCAAIDRFDVVCCHVEAPDEMSHQGDWKKKVASLEAIDEKIIGPVAQRLADFGDPQEDPAAEGWRLLLMPDHYTLVSTRKHDATPVPFVIAGSWVRSMVRRPFTETAANESDLVITRGHELMEYFLLGGLAKPRVKAGRRRNTSPENPTA